MKVRLMTLEDKHIIDNWSKERNLQTIPNEYLSKYGFLVSSTDKEIVAAWLYPYVDSKRCMFDCMISNPKTSKQERDEAIDLLLMTIFLTAKDMGYRYVTCSASHNTILNKLLKLNFTQNKNDYKHLTGEL